METMNKKIDEILEYHGLLNKDAGLHNDIVTLINQRTEALQARVKELEASVARKKFLLYCLEGEEPESHVRILNEENEKLQSQLEKATDKLRGLYQCGKHKGCKGCEEGLEQFLSGSMGEGGGG